MTMDRMFSGSACCNVFICKVCDGRIEVITLQHKDYGPQFFFYEKPENKKSF